MSHKVWHVILLKLNFLFKYITNCWLILICAKVDRYYVLCAGNKTQFHEITIVSEISLMVNIRFFTLFRCFPRSLTSWSGSFFSLFTLRDVITVRYDEVDFT